MSGGLESLSVWDDSDTDSRFRNLGDTRPRVEGPAASLLQLRLLWGLGSQTHPPGATRAKPPHGITSLPIIGDRPTDGRAAHPGRALSAHISGEPITQLRSRPLSPARPSVRSSFSSLRLRLVGGGVRRSSSSDSRSMLLYT